MNSPPLLQDAQWTEALTLANYKLTGDEEISRAALKQIQTACWILRDDQRRTTKGYSFEDYAKFGRLFFNGCISVDQTFRVVEMMQPLEKMKESNGHCFSEQFKTDILNAIEVMLALKDLANEAETLVDRDKESTRPERNSKPNLHMAVQTTYRIWMQLDPARKFVRKDFLRFAYLCLGGCGAGVTENSVAESYRRHLQPKMKAAS